jgi:hypothetical protein
MDTNCHVFNVEVAKKWGVEPAVILSNLGFWIRHNLVNNRNIKDGYCWTFNSSRAFSELFPYFNEKKIYRILCELEKKGAIKSGNYNKLRYDRTKWFTIIDPETIELLQISTKKPIPESVHMHFPNMGNGSSKSGKWIVQKEEMDLPEMGNGSSESVQPIPYINTDVISDVNQNEISDVKSRQEKKEDIYKIIKEKFGSNSFTDDYDNDRPF